MFTVGVEVHSLSGSIVYLSVKYKIKPEVTYNAQSSYKILSIPSCLQKAGIESGY
jgi:hypothetical protein